MNALDEETKDNILRNIGELFPKVSDLSFFRQIFDSENWDLEKSVAIIKSLLEYMDEGAVDNGTTSNNNTRMANTPLEPNLRLAQVPERTNNFVPTIGFNGPQSGFRTSTGNSVPTPPKMLYSSSAEKSGAVPKSTASEKKAALASKAQRKEKLLKAYNDGLKLKNPVLRIKTFALEGIKVLIIMRGCPGSGKSYLVQHLANSLSVEQSKAAGWDYVHPVTHHIFSADDFWIAPSGKYVFNSEYIEYAHLWNQKLVRQAASEGRSPIFVDNTHTRLWEMQAVATIAVEFGYIIEIIDTKDVNKKWAFNVNELVRRNVHGVHYDAIKRMVERYEHDIQPKHLLRASNLSYPPNMTSPQRCLVTFSSPPSKNQMKIFNTRFHFAPLKDILALKSQPATVSSVNMGSKANTASQLDRGGGVAVSEKDSRNPVVLRATESMTAKENYVISNSNRPWVVMSTPPSKDGSYFGPHPDRFRWTAPSSQNTFGLSSSQATNPYQFQGVQNGSFRGAPYPPAENQDTQPLINPTEYIWSSPYSSNTNQASQAANTPMDLLSSMNEDIGDNTSNQPLQPTKQTDSNNISSDSQYGTHTIKSDSSSDLLMSFDELSQGTSKSSSVSNMNHLPGPEEKCPPDRDLSPSKDPAEDDGDDSDPSCEDIPLTAPSNSCNEFGHLITSEYVLVQPDGFLVFQKSHQGLPVSLREFVATSKAEKMKKKLAKTATPNDPAAVNKFVKPFLKTASNVPMYCDDTLLSNGNTVTSPESVSKSSCSNTKLPVQNEPSFDAQGQITKVKSLGDGTFPGSSHSKSEFIHLGEMKTIELGLMTPQEFIDQVWGKFQSDSAAENKSGQSCSTAKTSASAEVVAPIVASTWTDSKEPEPVRISRSDSPKGRRSQVGRTLTKKCDKGTDANYFEIISKANTTNNDVVLFGNASSFQSSSSPPKLGGIKAVATHEKSSMTKSDESADEIDSGLEILTKMFPGVSLDCLGDLFEKCQNNPHWTANLLMDSGVEISESFNAEVLPEKIPPPPSPTPQMEPTSNESSTPPSSVKKLKKNRYKLTEEYLDLVKEFESSFILNEEHYSDTLKKVRETKIGRLAEAEPVEDPCTSRDSSPPNDQESSSGDLWDDEEGDMSLAVSNDFIGQLQNKFGPIPNIYGNELVVKLPVSLARQIYSYVLDSICQQVEGEQNLFDLLVKEDEAFARKLQEESDDPKGAMSFQEIMDHEMALRAHEREQGQANAASGETFASRLSQQLLAERFPNMDPVTLQNVLDVTNHSLHEATNLLASAGHVPVDLALQEAAKSAENEQTYTISREESIEQANAYHEVASKLNDMRQLYFQKAKESYNSGNHAVALFYRELFNWYSDQIKASNAKAAKAMLQGNEGATTLDLHYLHVSEAVGVLDLFLDESIRQLNTRKMEIFIITGRGLHSLDGKSKLKPAIKLRLKQRGLRYGEINPGMLKTVITKSSTVSYKLNGVQ